MEPRSLRYICEACGGKLRGGDGTATGVSTDSRKIVSGNVFFAIKGDRFDGHDFVEETAKADASAVVVERPVNVTCSVIEVGNVRTALGAFAAAYRRDFDPAVIAIGGSNGKTSTKDLLAAVLAEKFPTLRS